MSSEDRERMAQIQAKLKNVPLDKEESERYYVYYKEDIKYLLKKLEGGKAMNIGSNYDKQLEAQEHTLDYARSFKTESTLRSVAAWADQYGPIVAYAPVIDLWYTADGEAYSTQAILLQLGE